MVEILRKKIAIFCVLIYLQKTKQNGPTGGIPYSVDKWRCTLSIVWKLVHDHLNIGEN